MTAAASIRPSPRPGSTWRATCRPASTTRPRATRRAPSCGSSWATRCSGARWRRTCSRPRPRAGRTGPPPVTPRSRSYLGLSLGGFHRLAYWEWGPREAERTLVCVHGLTRQGRDFDVLARTFARQGWRVICPDLVGRGQSGWLAQPAGLHAAAVRRRHERAPGPARRRGGRLDRQLAGRAGRHDAGGPARNPDPPAGDQRHRPVHPGHGPAPARRLPQRPAAAVRRSRRGRALYPHHAGAVRRADRRPLAPPRRAQRPSRRQWRPPAAPRPRHRRGLPPLAPGQHR